jgi:hypothetical protein
MTKPARYVAPYRVRLQKGRGGDKFIVVTRQGARVSTHPHLTRGGAQAAADILNIMEMVRPHAEDPRPYEARHADAAAAYAATKR